MDLVEQLADLVATGTFDYIVIEASGICEPEPIARTICSMPSLEERYQRGGVPRLDCICTVVDALRLKKRIRLRRRPHGQETSTRTTSKTL